MSTNVPVQVSNILAQKTISTRCAELTALISSLQTEELRPSFQHIVENIVGFGGFVGWNLRNITRQNSSKDFETVAKFLAADGPLIELSYRLMSDQNMKFEFPIHCLPIAVERQILKGDVMPFLCNKIPAIYGSGPAAKQLLLNAFEFYFFMFAFLQMGCSADNSSYLIGWGGMADNVYNNLIEEYLMYFLPCDGSGVPNVEFNFRQIPDTRFLTGNTSPIPSPPIFQGDQMRPKLFKPLIFQDHMVGPSSQPESFFHSAIPAIQKEIWRTETVINTFMLFWMNIDAPSDPYSLQYETILPSVDLVKSIRIMVRHFHYFTFCVNNSIMHPLEEVKRCTFPVFQKKLYNLLRYLLARWPLDNSFRIVYETWLSYIQPWRYMYLERPPGIGADDGPVVDGRWYNFILENVLFYTYLYQKMIPRFEKVELVAVRNAHMLHRVSKVFSQHPTLKRMLKDIENKLKTDTTMTSLSSSTASNSYGRPGSPTSPGSSIYLHSPSKNSSQAHSHSQSLSRNLGVTLSSFSGHGDSSTSGITLAQVHHHIREMENTNFAYQPLFSEANREKISNLMLLAADAREVLQELLSESVAQSRAPVSFFDNFFGGDTATTAQQNMNLVSDRNKAIAFLDQSRLALARLFDLPLPDVSEIGGGESMDSLDAQSPSRSSRFRPMTRSLSRLSASRDLDSSQIYPKGKFNAEWIQHFGNPDLAPLRSDEQSYFFPALVSAADFLNEKFLPLIEKFYFMNHWKGKLMRSVVAKPVHYIHQRKLGPGRTCRIQKYLPPRINLRFMCSLYFPFFVLMMYLLGILFGVPFFFFPVWLMVPYGLYAVLKASHEPPGYLNELIRQFPESSGFRGSSDLIDTVSADVHMMEDD